MRPRSVSPSVHTVRQEGLFRLKGRGHVSVLSGGKSFRGKLSSAAELSSESTVNAPTRSTCYPTRVSAQGRPDGSRTPARSRALGTGAEGLGARRALPRPRGLRVSALGAAEAGGTATTLAGRDYSRWFNDTDPTGVLKPRSPTEKSRRKFK